MEKSKVYFIDFHTTPRQNIVQKLRKLLTKSGMLDINFSRKLVAMKIHFGEPGNFAYIRPSYVSEIVKLVKEQGALPFLTDANTLYKGRRANAVDHLQVAMEHGFNPMGVGCNVIIADGLKGTEIREIEINQKHCKTAKIGSAVADADILLSINHFKGHEMSGVGGALKNIGMGSGSIGGKLVMHSDSSPKIYRANCTGCNLCVKNCAHDAIHLDKEKRAVIDYEKCVGCGQCIAVCQYDSAQAQFNSKNMQEKMMEYALAVVKDKPCFHINFITDVSPLCDCFSYNDTPIVANLGIAVSADPVALDRACIDLVNEAPVNEQSVIGKKWTAGDDKFDLIFPETDWRIGLDYAEKIGIGTQGYELIKIQ